MKERYRQIRIAVSAAIILAVILDSVVAIAPAAEPSRDGPTISGTVAARTGIFVPTETPTLKQSLTPIPEPSKTPELTKTPIKRIVVLPSPSPDPTATNTPYKNDELFNDQVAQITLWPGELRTLKYLQTADHSEFCLKGANLEEIQVGIYEPGMTPEFAKNRFVNSKANGNFDKVVNKDRGCDQFAATGAGSFIKRYWPVAFHSSLTTVRSFFFTIGERPLGCLGASEKLRVIEDIGFGLITWIGKKCG